MARQNRRWQPRSASIFGVIRSSPSGACLPLASDTLSNTIVSVSVHPSAVTSKMAKRCAAPKWALRFFKSSVAIATRMALCAGCSGIPSSGSMMRNLRMAVMVVSTLPERVEFLARVHVWMRLEHVCDFEHQVAHALVKNGLPVLASQPVEDRKADAHERNIQPLGGLPAVAVGQQEIAGAAGHEILEI